MKKSFFLLLALTISSFAVWGQYGQNDVVQHYAIKAKLISGTVLNYGEYKAFSRGPVIGAEVDIEFLPSGKYAWEQRWGFPTIGVGLMGAHLGNYDQMGVTVAAYPYMLWTVARSRFFDMGIKTGLGLAFMSKGGYGIGDNGELLCMSKYLAGYANISLEAKIKFNDISALTIEGGGQWINNGELFVPNFTTNIFYGSIGYQHRLTDGYYLFPRKRYRKESLEQEFAVNIMLSGGAKGYQYMDKDQEFAGTLHADIQFKGTNVYMTGVGFDAFYNGVYKYRFNPYEGREADFGKRMRVGVAWNNSFIIGRVTLLADMGVYLYDPVKDNYGHTGKPFYSYDPAKEDGWLYLRAGVRCRLYDNLFAQVSMKTHLLRIDHLEFGLGYSIPMRKKYHMNRHKAKFEQWEVIHPDRSATYNHEDFNYRRTQMKLQQKIKK